MAVDPSGTGDVSATRVRWTGPEIPEAISSPVIVGTHVYRLHKPGVVECWDASTGKKVYVGRLPGISTTWASPVVDGDHRLYFASAGKSYVIQPGPEFRILAVNDLGDGNHPSPAVAQGRLFLAGLKNLYCIGQVKCDFFVKRRALREKRPLRTRSTRAIGAAVCWVLAGSVILFR